MRFDVTLFELRLFKSRAQASEAIQSGAALLRGERSKPSRDVSVGDRVTLVQNGRMRTVEVLELPRRSLTREAAQALIREIDDDS